MSPAPLLTFIGVGAQRAGTTWIWRCFLEHREIFVPSPVKELHFFSRRYDEGFALYAEEFAQASGHRAVGEITPTYLHHPLAAERIAKHYPDARIFMVLREPVERALSAYKLLREREYPGMSFAQAFEASDYLRRHSLYADAMHRYLDLFPESHVRVFLYEDLARPFDFLADLFQFLDVDPDFQPDSARRRFNQAAFPALQRALVNLGFGPAVRMFKSSSIGHWTKNRYAGVRQQLRPREISRGLERRLREFFRKDVLEVQRMIGRELSHWT